MKQVIFTLAVALLLPLYAQAAEPTNWLTAGERLHYSVSYSFFTAGEAELLYQPQAENGYTVVARAWAKGLFFNLLERLRVSGHHTAEAPFQPTRYTQMQKENDFRADKSVTFNPAAGTASYQNHRNNQPAEVKDVPANVRDMLSALYFLRQSVTHLATGVYTLPVINLHRVYTMDVHIGDVSSTRLKNGEKLFLREVRPVLTAADGSGKVKENWRIWITEDARRLPVKIELSSKFGTFTALLKNNGPAASPSHAPAGLPETGDFLND